MRQKSWQKYSIWDWLSKYKGFTLGADVWKCVLIRIYVSQTDQDIIVRKIQCVLSNGFL